MGTRADFYVGRGTEAEWLGSIAWDGYPDGIDSGVLAAVTEDAYRTAVSAFLAADDSATLPEQGWPWPWDDSGTTDYAYAFDGEDVHASCFGHDWFDPEQPETENTAIGLNPKFLGDFAAATSQGVLVHMRGADKPFVVTTADGDFIGLQMPRRVDSNDFSIQSWGEMFATTPASVAPSPAIAPRADAEQVERDEVAV